MLNNPSFLGHTWFDIDGDVPPAPAPATPPAPAEPPAPAPTPTPTPAPATPPAPTPAAPPAGKTFTQEDIDRIIGERLKREQGKYSALEQQYQQVMQMFNPQLFQPQAPQAPPDPYAERISQLENMLYTQQVDTMEKTLKTAHPDITDELMERVYEVATQHNMKDLEQAYRLATYDTMTSSYEAKLKAARDEAVKEYLKGKGAQPAAPEGAGGAVPPGAKVPSNWDEADKAFREFMKGNQNI